MSADAPRFTLRMLPLPAKLVISMFLISVGFGYFSAMVQLHNKHSDLDGNVLPTPDNVIERFSGLKLDDGKRPVSKLEQIISGPHDEKAPFDKSNMARAFFDKAKGYKKDVEKRGAEVVDSEHEWERQVMIAWITSQSKNREKSYKDTDDGKFLLPDSLKGKPVSEEFYDKESNTVPIRYLIQERCVKCHDGVQEIDLSTYDKLEKMLPKDAPELIAGKYIRSGKQQTAEGLTQTTHVHLLSFSVLYGLTGLIFAFTSLPGLIRRMVGPVVLIAQMVDISCWWLARMEYPNGPMFAQAIIATGAIVGMGLGTQIVVSLFDMFRWKGKFLMLIVGVSLAAALGVVYTKAIHPALEAEKAAKVSEKK